MPIQLPNLSDRNYQQILDELLARIPVHNPEWTNFNDSDPGITILQLNAFLIENLLYRSNQIPERNRLKFLRLLGIPLNPATPARGLVTILNERGPQETLTLNSNLEVRAGQIPYRTVTGLDVLPLEWRTVIKQPAGVPTAVKTVYEELYMSYVKPGTSANFTYYQTVNLDDAAVAATRPVLTDSNGTTTTTTATQVGVNLLRDTVDGALWIALLGRPSDFNMDSVRDAIAGRILNIAMVPALSEEDLERSLSSRQLPGRSSPNLLKFEIPVGGSLGASGTSRIPRYRLLPSAVDGDIFTEPCIAQVTLPSQREDLQLWTDVDPLEMGVGGLPPNFEDTNLTDRLITWIRVSLAQPEVDASGATLGKFSLLWAGLNTVRITQRNHVSDELLPRGTGDPGQVVTLANRPVVQKSVTLSVTLNDKTDIWEPIDDLLAAGPEVYVSDPRFPPGVRPSATRRQPVMVFQLDPESGEIHFGDGHHGARPPLGAGLRASYDFCQGRAGNVGAKAINNGPTLPAGFKVNNPVPTWGGAESETVQDGEKQVSRYLQHHDRLVTAEDFKTIALRTPGVEIGRIEVIPTYNPRLTKSEPGDTPGTVTLMVIPKYDPRHPATPLPDRIFLNAICEYLDPRRLVTTEVILKGPTYKGIWLTTSIRVVPGVSIAEVKERVERAIRVFLSPLPQPDSLNAAGPNPDGWPLRTSVIRLQLLAVISRVPGVLLVNDLQLSLNDPLLNVDTIEFKGLDLPELLGISVTSGPLVSLQDLRDQVQGSGVEGTTASLPVPVIPEMCQ